MGDDGAFDDSDVRWSADAVQMLLQERETPEPIKDAEAWRLAGARLRRVSPEIYAQICAVIIASFPDDDEEIMH